MILRDQHIGDLIMVLCALPEEERKQFEAFLGGPYSVDWLTVQYMQAAGPKWTFVNEKDPDLALVVGGFIPQRAGVYKSWFLATEAAWRDHGKAVTAMAAERLQYMLANGAHRIETVCLSSRKLAQRWYKTIGLRFEATHEKYGAGGEDAALYVITRETT